MIEVRTKSTLSEESYTNPHKLKCSTIVAISEYFEY